jgi:hypothetical protein
MADDNLLPRVNRRVSVVDDGATKGGIDVVSWAESIVDIVEELRRQTSSKLATMRDDHR